MNFLLDHDVPVELGRLLRLKGHAVTILREVLPQTTDDLSVIRYAAENQLIIVTCNRQDFLHLAMTESHAGMVILVRRKSRLAECASVLHLLDRAGESGIRNNINFA